MPAAIEWRAVTLVKRFATSAETRQGRHPLPLKALLDGRVRLGESQVRLAESKCW